MSTGKTTQYLKYAIGEIILVVTGILIALAINNANERNKNKDKEKILLEAIHQDFSKNLQEFNRIKALHIKTLQKQDVVLRNIARLPSAIAKDSISAYGTGIFGGYTYNASSGVVNSLISSGDINLISNDSLKNYLVSWNDVLEDYTEEEKISQQFWQTILEPYLIEKGIFHNPTEAKNFALMQDSIFLSMLVRKRHYTRNIVNEALVENKSINHHLQEIVRLSKIN
jgi:hypothetical protein